ncbi:hypothetical protein [Methylobacterium dankookense]|uniref:Uncharacterized protein n=1 Tax=Methylobacterium dankookense TaxID=560405 RepID=A0A564G1G5_9HYPH|nr:hypothetical protein [Methylobacterium dankookense]GJD57704.1 hypothetical protein IFDJLNFL_3616 [Methylobacterium dankookense]VUF13798.1 hypothetical protein MTDSW087_03505 [Methylobacterium dankookense]
MNDAQVGLLVAVPMIAAMAVTLHRAGALGGAGAVSAVAMAVGFGAVLFFSQ